MFKHMNLKPRVSEKAFKLSENSSVYVFIVPKGANKQSISHAVKTQFDVTVETVNITNLPAKAKRTVRKGGRKVERGEQAGVKKAYVTLKKGDSIPIFAQEDEGAKKEVPVPKKRGNR